ncbi:hypothetical protein IscW_ISCW015078 [Ixodes scapularis]|uniref:Uncharacterized protein n=1 Tax=Ixodes scapularis TaxID=6945 RepID=B7QM57_IXOSC|nr:hypothetical protein IscW_ISCW015078 [Ixodes scapularis]|eukprot:XP_002416262.1 hypothetical protein IscW_ISCW015078 [Ixodes scapularis]
MDVLLLAEVLVLAAQLLLVVLALLELQAKLSPLLLLKSGASKLIPAAVTSCMRVVFNVHWWLLKHLAVFHVSILHACKQLRFPYNRVFR